MQLSIDIIIEIYYNIISPRDKGLITNKAEGERNLEGKGEKMSEEMTLEEQKQMAIDNYVNLMRIKADEKAENKELDRQLKIAKLKLSTFAIDLSEIETMF